MAKLPSLISAPRSSDGENPHHMTDPNPSTRDAIGTINSALGYRKFPIDEHLRALSRLHSNAHYYLGFQRNSRPKGIDNRALISRLRIRDILPQWRQEGSEGNA